MSLLFVSNPASGSSDEEILAQVRKELSKLDEVEDFVASSAEAFAHELRAAAASFSTVVVAGGDGSLSHSVNALRDRLDEVRFGLIPMGTGNDLAGSLQLSDDPTEVAAGLEDAREMRIDVGRVTSGNIDRLFINACVGGFSVDVDESVDEEEKRKLGRFAFWLGGLRAARDIKRYRARVNDLELDDIVVVGIGNGRTVGGGLELWPDAALDDGVLEACAIAAPDLKAGVRAAMNVKRATPEEDENIHTTRGSSIVVEAEPGMEMNVDGEVIGLTTPARFEVAGRITLLVPQAL